MLQQQRFVLLLFWLQRCPPGVVAEGFCLLTPLCFRAANLAVLLVVLMGGAGWRGRPSDTCIGTQLTGTQRICSLGAVVRLCACCQAGRLRRCRYTVRLPQLLQCLLCGASYGCVPTTCIGCKGVCKRAASY